MKLKPDSLKYLHQQIDSLKKIKSQDFSLKLNEVSVQTALITASTTLITVFLGFLIKDYLIPLIVENRNKHRTGQMLFLRLRKELFFASNSLNRRIHEIYRTRSHYLSHDSPLVGFYEYKFRSTVFRLCTLLGWIRAYQLQQAQIEIGWRQKEHHSILSHLQKIESALADGQEVEMYVINSVLTILGVDSKQIDKDKLYRFSITADHQIHQTCQKFSVAYISEASDLAKEEFIASISKAAKDEGLTLPDFKPHKDAIIKEVSVKLALIYRDWQQAIGDMMLIKENNEYQTISYKIFETFWEQSDTTSEKKWLNRSETIFKNLSPAANSATDSRIKQLCKLYKAIYDLQKALYEINIGRKLIQKADFDKIEKIIN